MSNSESNVDYLFENTFAYVTTDGTVMRKKTRQLDNRKIGEINPDEEIDDQLEPMVEAYQSLAASKKELEERMASEGASAELLSEVTALMEKVTTSNALGDLDSLLDELRTLETEITKQLNKPAKKEEGTATEDLASGSDATEETDDEQTSDAEEVVEAEAEESGESDQESEEEEIAEGAAKEEQQQEQEGELPEGVGYYKELSRRAEELAQSNNWSSAERKLNNIYDIWSDGPDVEDEDKKRTYFRKLNKAKDEFESRKEEYHKKQQEKKKENLEKKRELLNQFKKLIEAEKWDARKEVSRLQSQWNNITNLPAGEATDLNEAFAGYVAEFKSHKVDRLVQKKLQEEENLAGKLVIIDKLGNLVGSIAETTENWGEVADELRDLKKQWRKIGNVPPEKNDETWGRYKELLDEYYDRKFEFDKKYRKKIEKSLKKKLALCEQAEALVDYEDLSKAAREVNKLHRKWKKAGNLPQREENELWNRFKTATDAFNEYKSEHIDDLKEAEQDHLNQKLELIRKAEELKDTTEWQSGKDKMQNLMEQWKKIGPVPRKKSKEIWKQFKGAMDHFFDRRREHFKAQKEEYKKNLDKKYVIIDKLKELTEHDDPEEAVNQAKPLQAEFKQIGFVPIKKKNQVWKDYRAVCDVIYDRFRLAKSNKTTHKVLKAKGYDKEDISVIQESKKKISTLKKEIQELEAEVIQYQEAKTYFKPSNKGNKLRDELQQKIDKAEAKLEKKRDQMFEHEVKLDKIERKAEQENEAEESENGEEE